MIKLPARDSKNSKLGCKVRATYREVGPTCPASCQHLQSGACYALYGYVTLHAKVSEYCESDGERLEQWLLGLPTSQKVRHHVSGDFMRPEGDVDSSYVDSMLRGHAARPDLEGWTYTHAWREMDSQRLNSERSLTVNASCDTVSDVVDAQRKGWPATMVVPDDQDSYWDDRVNGKIVICPNQTHGTTCSDCMLCFRKQRSCVVAFRAHGTGAAKFRNQTRDNAVTLCKKEQT